MSDATRGRGPERIALAAIDGALGAVVGVIVVLTALQVGGRYVAGASLPWVQELTRLLFVWMVMLGAAAAFARGSHIAYDTFVERAPDRVARGARWFTLVGSCAFLAAVTVTGADLVMRNTTQRSAVLGLPVAIAYASIPVGAALGIVGLVVAARRRRPDG